jgi:RNA polymerase sigma-70 factor (ECF subfamily)
MGPPESDDRLSRIQTQWTALLRGGAAPDAAAAQRELLLRYYGAAYRYLLGTVRDPAAAEDLTQEFAVRFLRGDFRRADPGRGRFRDFLKSALRHLAIDHWRRRGKEPAPLPPGAVAEAAAPAEVEALDGRFVEKWREELLAQAWEALRAVQEGTGQPFHTALRSKAEAPGLSAADLAARLGGDRGRAYSEVAVRKLLQRARGRFAELLVEEVARSLPGCSPAELEQELIDLDLLGYCKSALGRRPHPS